MSEKHAVRVTIDGEEFTVRSEHDPEYTLEVAAYVDEAVARVREMVPMADSHKAAMLAALSITDDLFQARQGDREAAARIGALADGVARQLPLAKRGRRAKGTYARTS
jgi:cell division protein ZapA